MRKQIDKQLEINWDHSLKEGFQSFARDAGLIPATSQGEKQRLQSIKESILIVLKVNSGLPD